jgi:amidohydrolase
MVAAPPTLLREADEILPGVIADRRHFHEHPELGFEEVETARIVAERLRSFGFDDVQTGVGVTGVVGLLHGRRPGKVVALRADMDALPIHEENEAEYRSKHDGVMHACGHDAHTAMLLGVARILAGKRGEFAGTIKFLFQPAEEGLGGAKAMVAAGALDNPRVDAAFGLHVAQDAPAGVIAARDGSAMMGGNLFKITVTGMGGHGALPHLSTDPIVAASAIVSALQTITSRSLDPVQPGVVTIGSFHAGEASNVIPNTAELSGTIRMVSFEQRELMEERLTSLATGIGAAMGAEVTVEFPFGMSPTINTPELAALVREVATDVVGAERVTQGPLVSASEDFSEFLAEVPGCFFMVGTRNEEKGLVWGHHHPRFDIDEEPMSVGMAVMAGVALRYLAS